MSKNCHSATKGAPKGAPKGKKFSKFCSFCKSKGLPEADYTSHFVKDQAGAKGKVCCPQLLKNECGYCHEIGHTPKFCGKLKARDERRKKAKAGKARAAKERAAKARNADGMSPQIKVTNMFEALTGYVTPEQPKEHFPPLWKNLHYMQAHSHISPGVPMGVWGGFENMSIAELEKVLAGKKQAKVVAKEAPKKSVKVVPKESVKVAPKESVKVAPKESVKVAPKESVKVTLDPVRDFANIPCDKLTGRWGDDCDDC